MARPQRGHPGGALRERVAGGGGRELAGLPEADEAFEAGPNAQEAGADQGMQRGANAWCGGGGVGAQIGRDDGEVVGQGSGCNF